MQDGLYQFIVGILDLFLWGGELVGEEKTCPAVDRQSLLPTIWNRPVRLR